MSNDAPFSFSPLSFLFAFFFFFFYDSNVSMSMYGIFLLIYCMY